MRISDWSSDVCSSDLHQHLEDQHLVPRLAARGALAGPIRPAQSALYQRGLQLAPKQLKENRRQYRHQRIRLRVQTLLAMLQIKKSRLTHDPNSRAAQKPLIGN